MGLDTAESNRYDSPGRSVFPAAAARERKVQSYPPYCCFVRSGDGILAAESKPQPEQRRRSSKSADVAGEVCMHENDNEHNS